MNPALKRMLGYKLGESNSPRLSELIAAEDPGNTEKLFSELMSGHRRDLRMEQQFRRPDGKDRRMRWTVWLPGSQGEADSAVVLTEDVTASPRDERRLHEAQKMEAEKLEAVGRLVGGVAHDFNNLLTGVMLYCDLLLASFEPGHNSRRYVEEIREAGAQAAGLIRQLLSVAGAPRTEPRVVSLNQIADSMFNLLTRLIGENIELIFHLDPHLGVLEMDTSQVQQILLNLVLNARDALPEGGQITVETCSGDACIPDEENLEGKDAPNLSAAVLVVSDNGRGMDAEAQARLFEPFFTTKTGGSGLGLATVSNIVERNGGQIHVSSTPGSGTRVTIHLPLASGEQVPQTQGSIDCTREPSAPNINEGVIHRKGKRKSTP